MNTISMEKNFKRFEIGKENYILFDSLRTFSYFLPFNGVVLATAWY